MKTILVWYRNDLRVSDHAPLSAALAEGAQVVPVYCFDPRHFGTTAFGFKKTGAFRAQFLLESLADLRHELRARGSDLVVRMGLPEVVLPQLAREMNASAVFGHQEIGTEERAVETALASALKQDGIKLVSYWGHTLHHIHDVPFAIGDLPEVFTQFRVAVEKHVKPIRLPLPAPSRIPSPKLEPGELPALADLGFNLQSPVSHVFIGGETKAHARLKHYIWDADRLRVYKETRNGMLSVDDSSKFSPWLAHGCISPREIYAEVQRYERERVKNDSTYWLVFELLWRDYFRFIALKHGAKLFCQSGLQGVRMPWQQDAVAFERWRTGQTGFPLVDANMRELLATGFMSNRGRQNVGSFLTKNLGLDWRMGAEWFESQLVDYDVCSNYGNWNYVAGVGNDARGFRFFNIFKQSEDYDKDGSYVKHWLPELRHVPAAKVHRPDLLSEIEQQRFGVRIGSDYPEMMVDLFESAKQNEAIFNAALKRSSKPSLKNVR